MSNSIMIVGAGPGIGQAGLRNIARLLAAPLEGRGIRIGIATVATLVSPGSAGANEVADVFWKLATDPDARWEVVYPAA